MEHDSVRFSQRQSEDFFSSQYPQHNQNRYGVLMVNA